MTRTHDLSRRRFLSGITAGTIAGTSLLAASRRAAAKKRGGTLTVGMPNDFLTFDPHNLAFANFALQQNLYDTLTRYDQSLKPLPGLAERWVVAPDGQSVTLTLRKGVKFHSGKDLVAADVVKNFEKAADKDRGFNMLPAVANVAEVTAPDRGHGPHQVQEGVARGLRPPPGDGDHRAGRHGLAQEPRERDRALQVRRVGARRPHDARAQHGLLGPGRALGRPGDLQGLQRLGRHGGRPPVRDLRPHHRGPAEGHGAAEQGVHDGPGDPRGPHLRDPRQRRQAALRQEGGPPRAPLRHRPPGRGEQRAVRRERADRAPVQPELAGVRPVGRSRSTRSTSSARRSSSRRPGSPAARRSA